MLFKQALFHSRLQRRPFCSRLLYFLSIGFVILLSSQAHCCLFVVKTLEASGSDQLKCVVPVS